MATERNPNEAMHDLGGVGNARRIDQLGRVVIPADLRKVLGIRAGDVLEIRAEGGSIVLVKLAPQCAICGTADTLSRVHDKHVCKTCVADIRRSPECAICGKLEDLVERNGKHVCAGCVHELSVA